jgi:hypothetical protein
LRLTHQLPQVQHSFCRLISRTRPLRGLQILLSLIERRLSQLHFTLLGKCPSHGDLHVGQLALGEIFLIGNQHQCPIDVEDGLQQLRTSIDTAVADPSTDYERSQGYQRVVGALLDAKQPDAALAIAQSLTPDTTKDNAVANVVVWEANNGKFADARNEFASMSNTQETFARVAIMRNLAVASAKADDVASALKLVNDIKNPLNRRGTLFLIAQTLPQ